jgi:ADP-heptose:LPS heptosyltransferase
VATKLKALGALTGRPIHAYVNESPDHHSVQFLQLLPQVAEARMSKAAVYDIHREMMGGPRNHRWSSLAGCRSWKREFDYLLVANGHLESGQPLATWLPELETEYQYALKIPETAREYARQVVSQLPGMRRMVLLYPSGVAANLGFHRNTWTQEHWVEVVLLLNAGGIKPVFVGANSTNDLNYWRPLKALLAEGRLRFVDTVGQTDVARDRALIELADGWMGLNSGGGIVSAMRGTPTVMFWADTTYPIKGAVGLTPLMQRSWLTEKQCETYRTLSYGSSHLTPSAAIAALEEIW